MAYSNPAFDETFSIPSGPSKPPWKIILGVIIVGVIVGGYLTASEMSSQSREVHLVNGTNKMYKVKVDKNFLVVQPMSHYVTRVPEGEVTIERMREDGSIDKSKILIQTPILTRLFENNTFIINPDRAAILLWERIGYGDNPNSQAVANAFDYKYHTGESFYHFKNIDYLFVHSPAQLFVDEWGSVSTRNRISIVKLDSAEEARTLIESEISSEAANDYLDNYLLADPDSYEHLYMLREKLSNQQFLDYLKPFIKQRPVLLNCHSVYITAMRNKDIQFDLAAQYRELLAEDPEDPIRIYILGIAITDREESLALYRKAAENPDAPEDVHHTLFINYLANGLFEEALAELGILTNSDNDDLHYKLHQVDTLLALKREADALKLIRACSRKKPLDGNIMQSLLTMEFLVNGAERAGNVADSIRQKIFAEYRDSDYAEYWKNFYFAHLQYISGDEKLSAETLSAADAPYAKFISANSLRRFEEMGAILNELDENVDNYLIAALAALENGDRASAKPWLDKAAELLEVNAGIRSRRIAGWLRSQSAGNQQIDSDVVCNYSHHVSTKLLLLAVMAFLDPANETQYFTLARKLNFERQFPYLLIKQVVGE